MSLVKQWLAAICGLACGALAIYAVPSAIFFTSVTAQDTNTAAVERWACPMLDFVGSKPGTCPVCGMTLQRVTAGELSRAQAKRMGVELTTVHAGPAVVTIHAYGAVRYDERTTQVVIARIAGRVVKRYGGALHPGLLVKAGEPLLDLYSPEAFVLQSQLAAAFKSHDEGITTALSERLQRLNLSHLTAAIGNGEAPSDIISIRSPFAGRVVATEGAAGANGESMFAVGAQIPADAAVVRLVDPDTYMIVVHVPEAQAHLLREGQQVSMASDDRGELPDVAAEISWVAPDINAEIRAREVHLHLTDTHHRLLPGSLVNARIRAVLGADMEPADAHDQTTWGQFPIIPASAVLSTGVRNVTWKLTKTEADGHQHFAIAPLALGQRLEDDNGNDAWVVRAGLEVGEQIATQGVFLIDSQAQLAGSPSLLFPLGTAAPLTTPAVHQH